MLLISLINISLSTFIRYMNIMQYYPFTYPLSLLLIYPLLSSELTILGDKIGNFALQITRMYIMLKF